MDSFFTNLMPLLSAFGVPGAIATAVVSVSAAASAVLPKQLPSPKLQTVYGPFRSILDALGMNWHNATNAPATPAEVIAQAAADVRAAGWK